MSRIYLDYNATAPLRPEARAAAIAAMDAVGNPSSVHMEGRAAKTIMERARAQIAEAIGAMNADIIFTSGATEASSLALAGRNLQAAAIEHEAVLAWTSSDLPVDANGLVTVTDPASSTLQLANSETGVVQNLPGGLAVIDATQGFGRIPFAFEWSGARAAIISAHKLGGLKGVGALIIPQGTDVAAQLLGGGQEMGRRSGTENITGIAAFGAAAAAAAHDLNTGRWDEIAELRDLLEQTILDGSPGTQIAGRGAARLPNTTSLITPGWKGETQVMAMDLAGFAISAGSACSSGKVRTSKVLAAMGYDADAAASVMRVSLTLDTTRDQVLRFAAAWIAKSVKHRQKAA
ncbi:putative aminotransferase [Ketogulonicigenium vulgare Y25]|uniref:Cysteine desulfurase n=1 Tax=Ketogulonicigenium vulgare (strain WSH-001) TaxID=759362 RepID=F9Y5W5_KETVW|nr:aminotransferase class V-fold PLP-dependent enzyme [Ketogulonicigenium vulgare]ADO42597.1 putative aminotransferase [Ketogulonicigenium vulgare Y25]AEM40790.1 Aminotransferase, class V [Ketogulonicigenium vulgare WSH-001]ALJ80956.1 aminotransferase [Ketogulonicigenium vulgare]AOZ54508.1 aminotransferase [Ketogulonicigenium vulgare]